MSDSPNPAIYNQIQWVISDLSDLQLDFSFLPHSLGLKKLENIEGNGEEYDRKYVDKQPLLETVTF